MSELADPRQNFLLAAMDAEEFERIAPHLELVSMPYTDVLYECNEELQYAYFPTSATASLLCGLEDGVSVEVAVVGNEGVLGVSIFMGYNAAFTMATIQTAGYSYRLPAKLLKREFDRGGSLQHLLMRYTRTLIIQMAQTTACNRRHSVEQQLCRWLLLNFDRVHASSLAMTQELISNMLGVRRESITEAARKLQMGGLISYCRGHIKVLDRPGLEMHVCECYDVVRKESERFLSDLNIPPYVGEEAHCVQ